MSPILFLLLFGTIEFGFGFFQSLDVRHGARETARLAAVDYGTGANNNARRDDLVKEACSRLDRKSGVDIGIITNGTGVGGEVTVTVSRRLEQVTGALDFALKNRTLKSSIVTRLEQPATFSDEPIESLPGNDCP